MTDLTQNPGPGAKYCPWCRKDSITRTIHRTGKASDPVDNARATCGHCGEESPAGWWMTWNQAREVAA